MTVIDIGHYGGGGGYGGGKSWTMLLIEMYRLNQTYRLNEWEKHPANTRKEYEARKRIKKNFI